MESSRFFLDVNNNLKIRIKAILFNRGTIFYDTFWYRVRVMVFNAPFNNISDILVEET
jgi:hypothetical protein